MRSRWAWYLDHLRTAQLAAKAWFSLTRARLGNERLLRVSPEDFAGNLRTMIRMGRKAGIQVVLLTAPTSHEVGREPQYLRERWLSDLRDLVPLHQEYARLVRTVGAEEHAGVCDLERQFKRLPPDEVRSRLFTSDGIHLTADGYQVLAGLLLQCFDENGLLGVLAGPG